MVVSRQQFVRDVSAWNKKKSFSNFKALWDGEFHTKNPVFKIWRIFRNTVNGRYLEIEQEGREEEKLEQRLEQKYHRNQIS